MLEQTKKHNYNYTCSYARGQWIGKRVVSAIGATFFYHKGNVSAYTTKQARFFVSKELESRIGGPVFLVDFEVEIVKMSALQREPFQLSLFDLS